jgi:hypothetical protein
MREPTYLLMLALALMLVAPSVSAFGREGGGGFEERSPEEQTRAPEERRTPKEQTTVRTQTFGGHVYHGQLAWKDGRWRHELRDGRDGWWWDVGGYWYYYPEQTEGPPDYVSDVEVNDATTATPSDSPSPPADWVSPPATSASPSPPATSASPSPPATSESPSPPAKIWISPQ